MISVGIKVGGGFQPWEAVDATTKRSQVTIRLWFFESDVRSSFVTHIYKAADHNVSGFPADPRRRKRLVIKKNGNLQVSIHKFLPILVAFTTSIEFFEIILSPNFTGNHYRSEVQDVLRL